GKNTVLSLRSSLERLSVGIDLSAVMIDGKDGTISAPSEQTLTPRGTLRFEVASKACPDQPPWWRWLFTRGGVELRRVRLDIKGRATAAPAEELVRVGLDPERPL